MLKDKRSNRFVEMAEPARDRRHHAGRQAVSRLRNGLSVEPLRDPRVFCPHVQQNLSVREFVAADWTFMNEALARHYGVPEISGVRLQRVTFPAGSPYGGLWTQPAVLKVTANGTFTSPVKRGVWVAERLLGTPIPPPPPDIPAIEPDTRGAKTLREQLAMHRDKGSCAACHAKFDPYGFALESFDPTGASRNNYRVANPAAAFAQKSQGILPWMDGCRWIAAARPPMARRSPTSASCAPSSPTIRATRARGHAPP
jgi:hypothetical protein